MTRQGRQMDPFPWSLSEIEALTGRDELSPQTLAATAAGAIRAHEADIRAWRWLDLESARRRATSLAQALQATGPRSPLHGVPYGVKDIFDTAGIPTEWGSATQRGRIPDRDCDLIARLESLGCVLVGKTETTAFAYYDTGPTRNPSDLSRTPGGSSSGLGSGRGRRHGAARVRNTDAGLGAASGIVLRRCRVQTYLRTAAARRGDGVRTDLGSRRHIRRDLR